MLKDFLRWLVCQPGYKSRINATDIDYLNMAAKEVSTAKAGKLREYPTIEQIRKVIFSMPTDTVIQPPQPGTHCIYHSDRSARWCNCFYVAKTRR